MTAADHERRLAWLRSFRGYTQDEAELAAWAADRIEELRATLADLADIHHRTLTGSKLHDPERIEDFRNCPCRTCQKAAAALAAAQEPPAAPTGLHRDPCACGHDHTAGREGTCGSFLCGCRKWEPPVDGGDR